MEPFEISEQTLQLLKTTRISMMSYQYISELEKQPEEIRQRSALTLRNIQVAILKLENVELEDIIDQLKENENDLKKGRKELKEALQDLKNIETILNAVNNLLGIAARFIALL